MDACSDQSGLDLAFMGNAGEQVSAAGDREALPGSAARRVEGEVSADHRSKLNVVANDAHRAPSGGGAMRFGGEGRDQDAGLGGWNDYISRGHLDERVGSVGVCSGIGLN